MVRNKQVATAERSLLSCHESSGEPSSTTTLALTPHKMLLSIVIANYNYGRYMEEAIQSVIQQCEPPEVDEDGRSVLPIRHNNEAVELIICDAASTDNSVDVIKKYNKYIAWWCSEKDNGQSAAFNKGFSHSKGEWLTWLNADDMYFKGVFCGLARLVKLRPAAEWITGNQVFYSSKSSIVKSINWGPHIVVPFLKKNKSYAVVFGPTSFFRRSIYNRLGPIDEHMHYAMDTEYWARLTMSGVRQYRLNQFCWAFRVHEESKTQGLLETDIVEKQAAEEQYLHRKTGYCFSPSLRNIWYLLWLGWRVLDGSLFVRWVLKKKYDGKHLACIDEGV